MHSVSDLTTSSRKTSGTVPPKLVGASTTIVGDKMFLFGGRLVAERRMVSDLYVFDLETFVWTKIMPTSDDDVPGARYFHSADSWNNYLIIFGGMGHKPEGSTNDDLVVLNDVRFFDIQTFHWLPPDPSLSRDGSSASPSTADPIDPVASGSSSLRAGGEFTPRARYAHLSSVSGARLYVVGGQDLQNAWLDDVCVYDLRARRWAARRDYPRHAGTYRSVAVAAQLRVRDPACEAEARTATTISERAGASLGPPGGRFTLDRRPPSAKGEYTPSENLIHLPYSTDPTDDFPNDIFLYSNYNFTDVKRELEVFAPQPEGNDFKMSDRSSSMSGAVLPPGLRFPTGAICGNHLIFAGTYLAHSYQSYSIWALDLITMTWTRLDPGAALASGSWFRAALWNSESRRTSSLLIFGNRTGSLVEDYNRRLLAWDDVAVLDLEAFGIYQPPRLQLDLKGQELGLAALEEGLLADFEAVCDDGRRISCSRRLLEVRWSWFREQRRLFRDQASRALDSALEQAGGEAVASDPPIPEYLIHRPVALAIGTPPDPRPDPRLTPRALILSEPYAVTLALLQYLYTQALLTPLQHAPAVLSQLLLLSSTYNIPHLQALVRHAMHRALAPMTSVGVYEVATLCGCQSLQIRALKAVMASSKRNTGNRTRGNSTTGGGGSAGGPSRGTTGSSGADRDRDGGPGGGGTANGGFSNNSTRARGISDVRGMNYGSPNDSSGFIGGVMHSGAGGYGPDGVTARHRESCGSHVHFSDGGGRGAGAASPVSDPDPEFSSIFPRNTGYEPVRPKHSARTLSMDTIYMVLNDADEDMALPLAASTSGFPSISSPGSPTANSYAQDAAHGREMDFPESCANSINQRLSTLSFSQTESPAIAQLHANPYRFEGFVADDLFNGSANSSARTSMATAAGIESEFGPFGLGSRRRASEAASVQSSASGSNSSVVSPQRRRAYSALADLAIPITRSTGSRPQSRSRSPSMNDATSTSATSVSLPFGASGSTRALTTVGEEVHAEQNAGWSGQIVPRSVGPAAAHPGFSASMRQRARTTPTAILANTSAAAANASDSDCPSLSSSLSSGLNIPIAANAHVNVSVGSRGQRSLSLPSHSQHQQSPLTPESPPLPTPADIHSSFAGVHSIHSLGALSAIDESSAYEGSESEAERDSETQQPTSARNAAFSDVDTGSPSSMGGSLSPMFSRSGLRSRFGKNTGGGNVKYAAAEDDADGNIAVIDICAPSSGDEDTSGDMIRGWSIVNTPASPSQNTGLAVRSPEVSAFAGPPVSPAFSTFAPSVASEYTAESSVDFRHGEERDYDEEGRETPNARFNNAGRASATNSGGSFFSRTRMLIKKRASDATMSVSTASPRMAVFPDAPGNLSMSLPSTPMTPTGAKWPRSPMSFVPVGPADLAPLNAKKAAKADERRRKKEEERKRLEALAAQFAAGRAKGKDGMSVTSSGSSEGRRAANDWLEESGAMYGSSGVGGWASL